MNLKEQLDAAVKAAQAIVEGAKAAGREMSDEDREAFNKHVEDAKGLQAQIDKAQADEKALAELAGLGVKADEVKPVAQVNEPAPQAKSLGENFVKSDAYKHAVHAKGTQFTVSAPEFEAKAAGDDVTEGFTTSSTLVRTQYGNVVPLPLRRPVISSLMPNGQLGQTSLTYYVQDAMSASSYPGVVGENAEKPELGFNFEAKTETLKKIAGWTAISDEALEDTPYLTSVINNQLLVRLALAEEDELLNGSGTGHIVGLLHRANIQSYAATGAASGALNGLEAIFHASTLIQNATFLQPDGIVISPNTYEKLRLAVDGNSQFYGGGPFTGAYGNGGLTRQPALWSYNTVVTQAIADNTILVGNFETAAAVWRKGGVRVDTTNTDADDFRFNRIKVRAEERLLLQVTQEQAFVNVTVAL